jgi:hypothetical protein
MEYLSSPSVQPLMAVAIGTAAGEEQTSEQMIGVDS